MTLPPLAADRLAKLPDGRLSYRLKTPWQNGTTHVTLNPQEFMARLAALVPDADGTECYLVDESLLMQRTAELGAQRVDPIKTTVFQNLRSTTTWVLRKP